MSNVNRDEDGEGEERREGGQGGATGLATGQNSNSTIKEMPSQEIQGSALIKPGFVT
jgi:hypothetical protein